MRKLLKILSLLVLIARAAHAQVDVPYFGKISWINGFVNEISGENLSYFSAFPDYANIALLTRATDGKKVIEWETASVPNDVKGPYVYFSWVAAHSSGTSKGERFFDLYINDEKALTFTTYPEHQHPNWIFRATDSTALVFEQTKRDGANDAHGLAYLRLPISKIKPGMPLRLKIVGQAQNSNDWYMTFKFTFEENVDVEPMPFLLKNGMQPIVLTALHFGSPESFNVWVNNKQSFNFNAQNGLNHFDIPIPAVTHTDSIHIKVAVGKKLLLEKFVTLQPVTYRELNLIHHSHTDIGYSHLQPEVLKKHIQNIDDALDMIDSTCNYPQGARFKWNVESLWAVEHFMKQALPQQKERFKRAVLQGSIGLSALYCNILTGLSLPEETFHYTDYAHQLYYEHGIELKSAMISDIPGYAWTTVTALAKNGVKYFSSGPNYMGETHPFMGDRVGHFVRNWADKPVWWESPSGQEKILFWTAGKGYSSWHGTAPGGVFDRGPKKIATYLNELDQKHYPYAIVQWRYNIGADNGPIDTSISRFVKQWNEKYASPKLVLNTTQELFETFENKYGKELPVVKGDITPYWEDGALSTAKEEGQNRANSMKLAQLTTLYSLIDPKKYNEDKFREVWSNIILFHEHTWGAYNSTSEPDLPFVTEQWRLKRQYMLHADTQEAKLEKHLLGSLTELNSNKIAVYNTCSWKRSGLVTFRSTYKGESVKCADGAILPLQLLSNGNYAFLAKDVPPLGVAYFEIRKKEAPFVGSFFTNNAYEWSNEAITFGWDPTNGSINTIRTPDNYNYAGTFNKQGLNSFWYVPGLNPAQAVTNDSVEAVWVEEGRVISTLSLKSKAPGTNGIERRISMIAGSNEIFIDNIVDKKKERNKESVHFGFPFNPQLTSTTLDAGYGVMHYPSDQLKGSNADYVYGRRWMDQSTNGKGIQMMMQETQLLEPDSMINEQLSVNQSLKQWKKEGVPTSTWFSYAMNNYWHTNYKADQQGKAHFRYCLRPHGPVDGVELERAAQEFNQPLIAIPVKTTTLDTTSLFELSNPKIVVTSVTPIYQWGFLVRLYNTASTQEQTSFNWGKIQATDIRNRAGGKLMSASSSLSLPPMSVTEVIVLLNQNHR